MKNTKIIRHRLLGVAVCMLVFSVYKNIAAAQVVIAAEINPVVENPASNSDNPLLNRPRDLAFDPSTNGDTLIVVNQGAPFRIDDGTYHPNENTQCEWRYGSRSTPPENSRYWPSFTVVDQVANEQSRTATNYVDPWGIHFLAEASSVVFGAGHESPHHHGPSIVTPDSGALSFGTCGESRNEMKGCVDWKNGNWDNSTPLDFQGPTLWSMDSRVFSVRNEVADNHLSSSFCSGSKDRDACIKNYTAPVCDKKNEHCEEGQDGKPFTLGSHLDMLHESPLCMGIAWEERNIYWVFDGCGGAQAEINSDAQVVSGHGENFVLHQQNLTRLGNIEMELPACQENGDIVRYDFRVDHGAGFDDHCDGLIERYAIGQVKRKDGVPSHMLMWKDHLFIADTGHQRIARLDPVKAGPKKEQSDKPLSERVSKACTVVWERENAREEIVETYFEGTGQFSLTSPSGIALLETKGFPPSLLKNYKQDHVLVVSDNAHSRLLFISLNTTPDQQGELLGIVELAQQVKPGGLMGLAIHPQTNAIYATDAVGDKIWSVQLRDEKRIISADPF